MYTRFLLEGWPDFEGWRQHFQKGHLQQLRSTWVKSCISRPRATLCSDSSISISQYQASPLDIPTLTCPIHPTSRILAHPLPARLPSQSRRRPTPYARLAVENNLLVLLRTRIAESVLKLLLCDVKTVGGCGNWDIDRVRDVAGGLELAWFANV